MQIVAPGPAYDIVVIGGGLVGATFACAARHEGYSILVVEASPLADNDNQQPSFDDRSTALSFGSSRILDGIGLWNALKANVTPITRIRISDRGHLGSVDLANEEQGVEALGYVAENRAMGKVLTNELQSCPAIEFLCPARLAGLHPTATGMHIELQAQQEKYEVDTRLVVLAEGGRSRACEWLGIDQQITHYEQSALVANVSFEHAHGGTAYERFTRHGPLAILPLPAFEGLQRGALVWTLPRGESEHYSNLGTEELLGRLQQRFGSELGRFTGIGARHVYPLSLSEAREQARPGLVLLGNVAHTLHPVAGQGLNLSLRDVASLVSSLAAARQQGLEPGDMKVLAAYLDERSRDQQQTMFATDALIKLFSSDSHMRVATRKLGLLALDLVPSARKQFSRQAMGL